MKKSPIIEIDELLQIQNDPELLIFDIRNGKNARAEYEKKHLKNAIFVDLNSQLAEIPIDYSIGGRHPLPNLTEFAKTLASLGISKNSRLVLYDDKYGANAAVRFWWMLKSIGHEKVQVLNGGLSHAEKHGFPIDNYIVNIKSPIKEYVIENWKLPLMDISKVASSTQNTDYLIVDVRERNRYDGIIEPIDLIAGHIPGAINIPFTENLDPCGLFLKPDELREKYKLSFGKIKPKNIVIHCGSGVTACHTILALDYAGMEIPNLYVGSWSEWSRNEMPIEKTNS